MANAQISDLANIGNLPNGQPDIRDDDYFLAQHDGNAVNVLGSQLTKYVNREIVSYGGRIVASNAAGGAELEDVPGETGQRLMLILPHGAGIKEVTGPETDSEEPRKKWWTLHYEDTMTSASPDPVAGGTGQFYVMDGQNGTGLVDQVMGVSPNNSGNVTAESLRLALGDLLYPVGSIYITAEPDSPALLFGGVWILITDRFLLSSGADFAAGAIDGAASKTVDVEGKADIGLYNYTYNGTTTGYIQLNPKSASGNDLSFVGDAYGQYAKLAGSKTTNGSQYAGLSASASHVSASGSVDVMPPYEAVYVWRRIGESFTAYDSYSAAGKYIKTSTSTADIHAYVTLSTLNSLVISCTNGDAFTLTCTNTNTYGKAYAFVDSNGSVLSRSSDTSYSNASISYTNTNATAAYLVVNYKNTESFSLAYAGNS